MRTYKKNLPLINHLSKSDPGTRWTLAELNALRADSNAYQTLYGWVKKGYLIKEGDDYIRTDRLFGLEIQKPAGPTPTSDRTPKETPVTKLSRAIREAGPINIVETDRENDLYDKLNLIREIERQSIEALKFAILQELIQITQSNSRKR